MSQSILLDIPDELTSQVLQIASVSQRTLADVVLDGILLAISEVDVTSLSNDAVVELANSMMEPSQQEEMSGLLAKQSEAKITSNERGHLNELLAAYRRGLLLKSR